MFSTGTALVLLMSLKQPFIVRPDELSLFLNLNHKVQPHEVNCVEERAAVSG